MQKPLKYGIMMIISGPSGTGKSTILNKLKEHVDFHFEVSCTTRKPREGEVDGIDYHFLTNEEFDEKIENKEFIEWAEFAGNRYGTLYDEVLRNIDDGRDIVLDIELQGALEIKEKIQRNEMLKRCAVFVFIAPPSMEELEKRLRGRKTETEEAIKARLRTAENDIAYWGEYDYLIVNKDVENAVVDMKNLFDILHKETKRLKYFIK